MEDLLNTGTVSVKRFHLVYFDPHCNTLRLVLLSPSFFLQMKGVGLREIM